MTTEGPGGGQARKGLRAAHYVATRAFIAQVRDSSARLAARQQALRRARSWSGEARGLALAAVVDEQNEELHRAEEELRAQVDALSETCTQLERERRRHADFFEHVPVACVVCDRAAAICDANPAAVMLFGGSYRNLVGRSLLGFMAACGVPSARALCESAAGGKQVATFSRVRGADFRVALTFTPLFDGERRLVVFEPLPVDDDDAAVETPCVQRKLRDRDELLGRERALRAKLEATNLAKDRFIAVLSHDLRGPINSVLGWTRFLRTETLSREARAQALEMIDRSSRMQLTLVEELLDLSRMAADKMTLELTSLDLGTCIGQFVETLKPAAEQARVSLVSETTPSEVVVFADRQRILQVASNLLWNALKFTPPGGHVTARVRADGPHAVFEVEDDGEGIEPPLMPELFDCYRQGSRAATARAGLGLGLYIVKQLVHLHGGAVEAHSEGAGTGSKFVVRLPLRGTPIPVASESRMRALPLGELDGIHVLVVEEDEDARQLLAAVLSHQGATVSTARNASDAVEMFESRTPNVVVSAVDLPDEDGCSLIARLHRCNGEVPAIAVTGAVKDSEIERVLAAGFDSHVARPIETRVLVERVRTLSQES